jgi:hypothetical protein
MQVDQRLVLGDHDQVDQPVIVQVAGGQSSSQVMRSPGHAGLFRNVA